jgi:Flp pilus assembly protein TadD
MNPSAAIFHGTLGRAMAALGKLYEASIAYRQSLRLDPDQADLWYNLGNVLHKGGAYEDAAAAFREALTRIPNNADAWNNLGNSLYSLGRTDEAIDAFNKALALQPDIAEAHNNLGNALREKGKLDESIAHCRSAIKLDPNYPEAHNNLGSAMLQQLRLDEATSAFERALELKPDHPYAHLNLGLTLLLRGDFEHGWEHYEWRWKLKLLAEYLSDVKQPKWDGSALDGKRILLHAEQGFGDTIQFARLIPQVADRGGKVTLLCPPQLIRLLKGIPAIDELIPPGQGLPKFDVHCPLLSLAHVLGITVEKIPAQVPYLRIDPELSSRWRKRMPEGRRRIGLVWAGRASNQNDPNRSIRLEALVPLGGVEGIQFVSLQKGDAAAQASNPPVGMSIIDCGAELEDFTDTAALIDQLDLLITVDTAAAHLAGALGKPVWILLPHFPDWRWMLDREDSPWYPTARLFRQPAVGDWKTPIDRIAQELRQ